MKTKIIALSLIAATAFAFAPKTALAGDKELAVVGGLIGGLIIGSAIADHDDDTRVVVAAGHRYDRHHRDDGYWKRVEVRVWVPGYWVTERHRGRTHRHYVDGHYEIRTDRVWVSYDRHHRRDHRGYGHDYDRYDRDYRR
jgi:hypothetical protein